MVTVTKEVTFDCAHMLDGHEGLCRNLHGHTYKVQVTARRSGGFLISKGPAKGMVLDFSALKGIMQAHIVEPFDHAFVYHGGTADEFEESLYDLCEQYDKKVMRCNFRPTAENMANYFYEKLNQAVRAEPFEIINVKVWETPTSFAERTEKA